MVSYESIKRQLPILYKDRLLVSASDHWQEFKDTKGYSVAYSEIVTKHLGIKTVTVKGNTYTLANEPCVTHNHMNLRILELDILVYDISVDMFHQTNISMALAHLVNIEIDKIELQKSKRDKVAQEGAKFTPKMYNFEGVENTLQDKYLQITGSISDLTKEINASGTLGALGDISKAFLDTKTQLESLTSHINVPKSKVISAISKTFSSQTSRIGFLSKWSKNYQENKVKSTSVQENIDYLFGLIHQKYEQLVTTGETLQKTRTKFNEQINALAALLKESDNALSSYANEIDIPVRDIALNTQIKSAEEKYKQRLSKIDGALMSTKHTIATLGKELPALKTDLTDEMAIGSLLSTIGDYQEMYVEIANLVSNVTEKTAVQTHEAVENLLNIQINDTHTIEYLKASAARGERFARMVEEKSMLLVNKVKKDSEDIKKIVASSNLLANSKHVGLIH